MTTETTVAEQPLGESEIGDRIAEQLFGGEEADVTTEERTEAASEAVEQAGEGEVQTAQEPALEDVEWNGKTYKLPPELKPALMAQSDYTRKTQEVADQRRMLDIHVMAQQQENQFQQSVSPEIQRLQMLDSQLAQYKALDWTSLTLEQATQYRLAVDKLKDDRTDVLTAVDQKRGQFNHNMQSLMAQARQKGEEYLKRSIPAWNADVQKELGAYGQAEGYSDVELGSLTDARMIKTLWKAQQWDKLQSQKALTTKRAEQAPPLQKPGASSNKTAKANAELQYQKGLKNAKTSGERSRVIQARMEEKLFGP